MIKLDFNHFGDQPSQLAAAALAAAPEGFRVPIAILVGSPVVSLEPSDREIAAIARMAAIYAEQFRDWYAMTGSSAAYGSDEFDELVDRFEREVMGIEPDYLEYHYPATAVFDYCRAAE